LEFTLPSILFLQETLVKAEKARSFLQGFRPSWSTCAVSSVGTLGGSQGCAVSSAGNLNSTFLALIPKSNKPQTFGDYRSISLCNLVYKLISKVIANCIKPILSRNLSVEQFGFLEGRLIHDVIGIDHECNHSIKQKHLKALILKLDL
jgi:hypothetical protein